MNKYKLYIGSNVFQFNNFRKHRKENHEILAFKCDKCDCKYPEQTTLIEHRRTKHGRTTGNLLQYYNSIDKFGKG